MLLFSVTEKYQPDMSRIFPSEDFTLIRKLSFAELSPVVELGIHENESTFAISVEISTQPSSLSKSALLLFTVRF